MRRPLSSILCALAIHAQCFPAMPVLFVVVNPDSGVSQLSREEVRNIFLGRQKSLVPGVAALPVEQQDPEVRSSFYRVLVKKDLAEINAYWARLMFTGQARPPQKAESAEAVVRMVASERGAVGLMRGGKDDRRVKVVLILGDEERP
ncbi:MAG TPA: hypothetical protein VN436_06055 [Holophaga sp.]|nr:hypothetical protein [Holophaga sp.]